MCSKVNKHTCISILDLLFLERPTLPFRAVLHFSEPSCVCDFEFQATAQAGTPLLVNYSA